MSSKSAFPLIKAVDDALKASRYEPRATEAFLTALHKAGYEVRPATSEPQDKVASEELAPSRRCPEMWP